MPTYVHQNVGLFSNAAEMKRHVNRTCLLTGFKSQTGMSSFRLSCERTLSFRFQCSDRSITYYRETKRHLKVKVGEHIIVSALIGERDSNKKKCP